MTKSTVNNSALSGIRIIDASRVLGGPYAGQILADHGADVIKVEPPQGDETRLWGPPFQGDAASYFLGLNRNKRGMSIDFGVDAGRELLFSLLETADVFLENFKVGTLDKWGIGKDDIAARFPALIHCRVSGFGADGPYGGLPGYDAALQATTGIMSVNGDVGGRELRVGLPVVDMVTGLNATVGVLLALNERSKSGKGQFVEASLYDCGVSLLHPHLPNYYLNGKVPGRSGNAHSNISPYDTFDTATSPIFLAVGNNGQFEKLCTLLGIPELATDPMFDSNAQRVINRDALKEHLERALSAHRLDDISELLLKGGVPCGGVRTIDEVVADAHTHHREMIVDVDGHRGTGSPIKLSRTPVSYRRRPPKFAEHTSEIMEEIGIERSAYKDVLPGDEDV